MFEEADFEYDVFISYSSRDKDWVRGELLDRIEKSGLHAFVDFATSRGAPRALRKIERGIVQSRKTLVVLTPDLCRKRMVRDRKRDAAKR